MRQREYRKVIVLLLLISIILGIFIVATNDRTENALETTQETIQNTAVTEPTIVSVTYTQNETMFKNEFDEMIYQATKDTMVDPYLAIAVARHETGHYTSDAFVNGYNFGGMTGSEGVMYFESLQDGLSKYVEMLEWYVEDGLDTPVEMNQRYCPPDSHWSVSVSSIMDSVKRGEYE